MSVVDVVLWCYVVIAVLLLVCALASFGCSIVVCFVCVVDFVLVWFGLLRLCCVCLLLLCCV